jgi:hypothetical protein
MSEYHDIEAPPLLDDTELDIRELLGALHESKDRMIAGITAQGVAPKVADWEDDELADASDIEDFTGDEAGDFIGLDAGELPNSADLLQLNDEGSLMQPLFEEPGDAEQTSAATEEHEDVYDTISGFTELEQQLLDPAPLVVPAPVHAGDVLPGWLSPMMVVSALLLSGVALWFALNGQAAVAMPVAASGKMNALDRMQVEFASIRERLSAVEKRVLTGDGEVPETETVIRMEPPHPDQQPPVETLQAQPPVDAEAVEGVSKMALGQPVVQAATTATMPEFHAMDASVAVASGEAVVVPPVADRGEMAPEGKIFVTGWAVNLRSYYHKADAQRLMRDYQQTGIAAELREITSKGVLWHRVRVVGFASENEANAFIAKLTREQGREMAWASYYQGYVAG